MPKTSSRSPSALVHEPEEWPRVFEEHLNAGDLEGVVALYEGNANFVAKAQFQAQVKRVVAVGDVALLYTDWVVRTAGPSGNADEATHRAIEVLRRQPDGTWKLIVGDPNGRR